MKGIARTSLSQLAELAEPAQAQDCHRPEQSSIHFVSFPSRPSYISPSHSAAKNLIATTAVTCIWDTCPRLQLLLHACFEAKIEQTTAFSSFRLI
jgi:hypothetical protein